MHCVLTMQLLEGSFTLNSKKRRQPNVNPLHLQSPFSCVLQMPTGSGKTWLARQEMLRVLQNGGRAIYVTPLRALAAEVCEAWNKEFSGFQVGVFTGDFGTGKLKYPVPFSEAQLLIMTPERLDACTRAWRSHWDWIPKIDLVVVDEIHLLSDANRGPRLEGAISRFRRLNPFARFIGLTATVGNPDEIAAWLDGVALTCDKRPVPLDWKIVRYRKASDKVDLLVREVRRNLSEDGASLVFVQSRRRAEELSNHLQAEGLAATHHHAGLTYDERRKIEQGFRNGEVRALVATSTLEMGLNLPVRQVVLYDLQGFNGSTFQSLTTNTVWQRVGRAGRPGLDTKGEAVLLAAAWDKSAEKYSSGKFESIRSGLCETKCLSEQILTEVGSGMAQTRHQVKSVMSQSLGFHQSVLPNMDSLIQSMCDAKLLAESEDDSAQRKLKLRSTRLGRIAVRHMLSPQTVLSLQRTMEVGDSLTFLDLLLAVAATEDCEPVIAVDFEELDVLASETSRFPSTLLTGSTTELLSLFQITPRRLLSAIKMAAVARQWTTNGDLNQVASDMSCYPFEIARLADSLQRLLGAASQVLQYQFDDQPINSPDEPTILQRIRCLQHMVCYGLDDEAVSLTFLKGVGGKLARRMSKAGIADIEALALASPEDFESVSGVSHSRAQRWITEAEELVKQQHAGWLKEDRQQAVVTSNADWPTGVDPYRLRRAMDLLVEARSPDRFVVTGGLEPHQVEFSDRELKCDCMDHVRGHLCKHIFAVRLKRGDSKLATLVRRLGSEKSAEGVDLFQLWFSSDSAPRRATA